MTRPHAVVLLVALVSLALVSFAVVAAAQDCYDYEETFQVAEPFPLSGPVAAMAVDQDRAIVARGHDLVFLDIANPDAVTTLGSHTLGEAPLLVASAGYLAVIASDNSLMMVDWSDPSASHVTAATSLPNDTRSLTRDGDHVLISRGENGVRILGTDDYGQLSFLGDVDTPGVALSAAIHDGWLVVADTSALLSVDITDPGAPVIVDTYIDFQVPAEDRDVHEVQSQGGDLVAAVVRWHGGMYGGPTEGLDLMAVSPAGQISLVATNDHAGDWPGYSVRDGSLHVSHDGTYTLYDLSDYPVPSVALDTGGAGIVAAGANTVLHRVASDECSVYDVRYPFYVTPDPDWSGETFHDIDGGQHESGWVLKSKTEWSGLVFSFDAYLYDVRDPENVGELTGLSHSGDDQDYAYAAICAHDAERVLVNFETGAGAGCRLSDLSTGSEITTWLPYSGSAVIAGNRVYQISRGWDPLEGLACLDVSTPGVVTEIGFRTGAVDGSMLALDETTLVILDGGLQIVDFTDPAQPVDRGALPAVEGTVLERRDDRIYLANLAEGITAVDISDLDAPFLVWNSANLGGYVRALDFSGDLAAVAVSGSGANFTRIYDLGNDLLGPQAVSPALDAGAALRDVLWDGDILYTSELLVYDLTYPAQPVLLGRGTNARSKLERHGDSVVTAAGLFPVHCVTTGAPDGGPVPDPAVGLELSAAPNPFNPRAAVQFVLPEAGPVNLEVFELTGRRVRVLLDEHRPAGPHAVIWDGRDDRGRDQASGIYIARLRARARHASTKLVLVR